jgi:hypothetical protein
MRALLALVLVLLGSSPAAAQTQPRSIEGRIVRASNGAALARARVVVAVNGRAVETLLTDVQGRFSVSVPTDGVVTLTCTKAGFAPFSIPLRGGATLLDSPDHIAMEPGAAIAGRVIDAAGAPALAARVTVVRLDGEIPGQMLPLTVEADDRGEYRVGSLPQGRYRVSAAVGFALVQAMPPLARFRADRIMNTRAVDILRGTGRGSPPSELPPGTPAAIVEVEAGRTASTRDLELAAARQLYPPAMAEATTGGAIRGYVRTSTGLPIPGAQVRLSPSPYGVSGVTRTRADGSYEMLGVPAGRYGIEAHKDGQDPSMMSTSGRRPPAIPIVVGDGALDVDIALASGGAIEGTVVDDQGDPMEGVVVAAFLLTRNGDRIDATRTGRERVTDDRGRYRLFELPAGEYIVAADANAEPSGLDRHVRAGLVRVFHPSVFDIDAAARVVLAIDAELAGVDIEYGLTPTARVRGTADDSRGDPVDGFALLVPRTRQAGVTDEPRFAPIGPDGALAFTNVPPGNYVLQVIREAGMGQSEEFAAQLVSVGEVDPAPLSIRTAGRSSIRGRVLIEGPGREGRVQGSMSPLTFRAVPLDPDLAPSFEAGRTRGIVSSSGTFEIGGLVGPTRITPSVLPDGWYAKSFMLGRVDLLTTVFDFGGGQSFDRATLVLSAGGVIEGRVTPPRQGPVREPIVFAFSTDRTWWGEPSQYVKVARAGQDGQFHLSGLPPGEYLVAAADAGDTAVDFAQPGADLLQRLASRARRVEVDEGETRRLTIEFR